MTTLADAKKMVELYLQAEQDLLAGKTISFNGRTVSSESLGEIRKGRQEWQRAVNTLTAAATRRRSGVALARFTND